MAHAKLIHIEAEGDERAIAAAASLARSAISGSAPVPPPGGAQSPVPSVTQRTFHDFRSERRDPRDIQPRPIQRQLRHADALDLADRCQQSLNPGREAALNALRALFEQYVSRLGVGARFQTVHFTAWLDETNQRPEGLDLRCMGALALGLVRTGRARIVGYQPDGGNPHTNHNSAVRPVFEIVRAPQ